jgi:hypothetical protein
MVPSHGSLIVRDFCFLYQTIDSSIQTLKQLGQSRYSAEMKDNLLYWCNVVERATRLVEIIKTNLNSGCETFNPIYTGRMQQEIEKT